MFLLDVGSDRGVKAGDPVLMRNGRIGLVGVIREVDAERRHRPGLESPRLPGQRHDGRWRDPSVWWNPGPGAFRGESRLLLNAIPYHERLDSGTLITTSGLGGVYPRGIPIGEVLELHEEEGGWRSEYWLRPVVETGGVTHVLVVEVGP